MSSISYVYFQLLLDPKYITWIFAFYPRPSGIVIAHVCVSVSVSVCVYQSLLACPLDNSSAVQARITKFEI